MKKQLKNYKKNFEIDDLHIFARYVWKNIIKLFKLLLTITMPNRCFNSVTINGPKEDIRKIRSYIKTKPYYWLDKE
jgi:hypothetical protein